MEPAGNDNRGDADHVYPKGEAVRTTTYLAVLGHRFIGRRHLRRGVNQAIQVQTIENLVVGI